MSVGLPSDEVAEDYKSSLEDLTINSRFEINNLTVIAKENTEHALAISRVLENHIKNTPPDRKLVALYVLDSIVKNVGTPYTLFLGRNLYQIFMDAYSLVNSQVRRKLDEMLRTWKEPVPGSLDSRPVFPPDTTRPIENALIKARTAAITQQQQQQSRTQQEMMARSRSLATPNIAWRDTPTPPQSNGQYRPPPAQGFPQPIIPQNIPNGQYNQPRPNYPQYNQYPVPQPTPPLVQQSHQQPPAYTQYPPRSNNLDSLHADIDKLVRTTQDEFASNPYDVPIRDRLQALLDLQSILRQQQLPPEQIEQVREQVTRLSATPRPPLPIPASIPPVTAAFVPPPHQQPRPSLPISHQPTPPQNPDLQALLSSNNLADIIAKAQRGSATPPVTQAQPVLPQIPPSTNGSTSSFPTAAPLSLIDSLRAAGMLTPTNGSLPAPTQTASPYRQPPNLHVGAARTGPINDVQLTAASLKIPRPYLISTLYEAQPNQCTTCGRRFLATEEGREKKARHLDWHFRTNQRLADATRRGQSRSWYVDELEWIKSRDDIDGTSPASPSTSKSALHPSSSSTAPDPRKRYVPVPTDQTLAKQPCPICQEQFDTIFSDDAQDFVWMDAVRIGARVYHASCHGELKKEGGSTPGRTGTPDSVLGKRKAVDGLSPFREKAVRV